MKNGVFMIGNQVWSIVQRLVNIRLVLTLTVFTAILPNISSAEHPLYGPRLEIGGGLSGARFQSRPNWVDKYSFGGTITAAVRIYEGLSVQVGKDYTVGDEPRPSWIEYGKDRLLETKEGTVMEVSWGGLRYEIPARYVGMDFFGMSFVYALAGVRIAKYGIMSGRAFQGNGIVDLAGISNYRIAKITTPYAAVAGRWRFKTDMSEDAESWFGSYGLDVGVRYIRGGDVVRRHDNIMKPKSHFNSYELFIIAFMKIRFLS